MINLNHLGHSFIYSDKDGIVYDDGFLYNCQSCGIAIIFWNDKLDGSGTYIIDYSFAPIITELNLTCDEWIIKNIID